MKINHNIQALNAYRNLYQNQANTSKNLEKLSSGLRINRAADDAAGLAISEKMRSQIRGLGQAEKNSLDGISLMQTAEGAMTEVHSMLQRMRELSVQSANDTNTADDRAAIQAEVNQLKEEIDRIGNTTEFNTLKLLDGSKGATTTSADLTGGVAKGLSPINKIEIKDGSETQNNKFSISLKANASTDPITLEFQIPEGSYDDLVSFTNAFNSALDKAATSHDAGFSGTTAKDLAEKVRLDFDVDSSGTLTNGQVNFSLKEQSGATAGDQFILKSAGTNADVRTVLGFNGDVTATATGVVGSEKTEKFGAVAGSVAPIKWDDFSLKFEDGVEETANQNNQLSMTFDDLELEISLTERTYDGTTGKAATDLASDVKAKIESAIDNATISVEALKVKGYKGSDVAIVAAYKADLKDGLSVKFNEDNKLGISSKFEMEIDEASKAAIALGLTNVNSNLQEKGVTFQIGASASQTLTIGISDIRTAALEIEDVNVSTITGAQSAIEKLDAAIQKVSLERSKLGAYQNRLEHTVSNLQATNENLTAAESRIRDTDMAKEMTEFTKNNILNQSAQSMLSQANQLPQGILQLLQG